MQAPVFIDIRGGTSTVVDATASGRQEGSTPATGLIDHVTGGERVVILAGGFGSGKTEIAANLALFWAATGQDVILVDADNVSPLFRSRELAQELSEGGVRLVAPPEAMITADLPVFSAEVYGALQSRDKKVVLDVGGNDWGARILGSLKDQLDRSGYRGLYVINSRRPFSSTLDEIERGFSEISASARISFQGLVSNTNLGENTAMDDVLKGHRLVQRASQALGLPVVSLVVNQRLAEEVLGLDSLVEPGPVFVIERRMLAPWER